MSNKKSFVFIAFALLLSLIIAGCSSPVNSATPAEEENTQSPISLLVYSGAGLKNPMEEIKTTFEADNNVKIEYVYAGSAQLISQIETSGKGDVFIVGSKETLEKAIEKGFANEPKMVAHHTPAIAVAKGNPKNIHSLDDLQNSGIRIVLGDPEANAIGRTAKKMIEKNKLEGIDKNVVAKTSTINEIVLAITNDEADAGIVTEDSVYGNKDSIELIEIPKDQNVDQLIPVCTLKQSENQEMAEKLVEFIASDKGKAIFDKYGFKPVTQ